ncbi:MAG: BamA/TamA family outer membrane protein, partial [Myxococcota bacterium]|nr:BamA/TamA family outer membrane protein [Myxococcota bacterium]
PEPPPVTIGTPVPGSASAPPSPPAPRVAAATPAAPVALGFKYALEGIEVRGNTTTLSRVVLRYVPFRPGAVLDVNDPEIELTRFRLLGTGFFRDVQLSLRRGTRRGYVVLVVSVVERNTIVVDGAWLGVSADVGANGAARALTAYGGAQVTETNLAGTGVALGGAFATADGQLALRARLADPEFLRSNWTAETELLYNAARDFFGNRDVSVGRSDTTQTFPQDFAVVPYKRFGGRIAAGHDLGVSSQIVFGYRLENIDANASDFPLAASDHRGLDVEPIDFMLIRGSSILSTIGATYVNDTRDEPFLPTRGHHLVGSIEASLTPLASDYPYAKLVLSASEWFSLSWGHVMHIEGFAGAVFGNAPLFERFYVGDMSDLLPDRVLDLKFDRGLAPNFLGTDIVEVSYGNYAAKVDVEYRIPLYRGTRSIYGVDLFGSAGVYGLANQADFVDHARGYSGFGAVPMDLTFNAGFRIDTQAGGFVFGLSNLAGLGIIPVRGPRQGAVRP